MTFWHEVKDMSEWIEEKLFSPFRWVGLLGLTFLLGLFLPKLLLSFALWFGIGICLAIYTAIPAFVIAFTVTWLGLGFQGISNAITRIPHDSFTENFNIAFESAKNATLIVGFICGGFISAGVAFLYYGASVLLTKGLSYILATGGVAAERIFERTPSSSYIISHINQPQSMPYVWSGEKSQHIDPEPTYVRTKEQLKATFSAASSVPTPYSPVTDAPSVPTLDRRTQLSTEAISYDGRGAPYQYTSYSQAYFQPSGESQNPYYVPFGRSSAPEDRAAEPSSTPSDPSTPSP